MCFAFYVLMEYGTGAIMAVPAHDERDFAFAHPHGLPIRPRSGRKANTSIPTAMTEAYPGEGCHGDGGRSTANAHLASIAKVAVWLREDRDVAKPAVTFRLRDWLLGRQRYWGAPIPIVHCGTFAARSPCPMTSCRSCFPTTSTSTTWGGESRRWQRHPSPGPRSRVRRAAATPGATPTRWTRSSIPPGTLFRYCSPGFEDGPFPAARTSTAGCRANQYTGGVEHAILHLMYARFFTKALYDFGLVGFIQPFPCA